MIISLHEARDHLRSDTEDDDGDLTLKIWAASSAVLTYLNLESADEIPDAAINAAKIATLMLVGEFYRNREGAQDGDIPEPFGYGYLPRPVVAILYPHRDPALA